MSQLRLGRLPDGTRQIVLLEPAPARRQGHGGSAMGYFSGVVLTGKRSAVPLREKDRRRRDARIAASEKRRSV